MKRLMNRKLLVVGVVVALVLGLGGAAFAAVRCVITQPPAPYTACSNSHSVLSVMLPYGRCPFGTVEVTVGATGATGTTGATGATGATGPAGLDGVALEWHSTAVTDGGPYGSPYSSGPISVQLTCPSNAPYVISGAATSNEYGGGGTAADIVASIPYHSGTNGGQVTSGGTIMDSWQVTFTNIPDFSAGETLQLEALCSP